jgi:protein SCO1/2
MMNSMRIFVTVAVASVLAACGPVAQQGENLSGPAQDQSTSIEGLKIGGPFTLTDQDGKGRTWDEFKGHYRLVYFGYTYCPDVCPLDLQQIMQGYAAFAKKDPPRAAKVQPIFITIDPERDTPEALKPFVSAFSPRLVGLTGTVEQVAAVAKQFAVVFSKEQGKDPKQYLVAHSRTPYLFGPQGEPIALVPVDNPATPEKEGKPQEILTFLESRIR